LASVLLNYDDVSIKNRDITHCLIRAEEIVVKGIVGRLFAGVATVLIIIGILCPPVQAEKNIGVLVWSEETHYQEAKDGVMEQMSKAGFGEPKVKFTVLNAAGSKAKASEIARNFATKMDMVISIGTSATVAVAKEIKDIPVVFSVVYDPVDSKIAEDWKSSGNNTTGSSSKVPMSSLIENLKQLAPVKNLAVLYTPGEKNSEAQLKDLQAAQAQFGMKILPVPIANKEEVSSVVSDVAGRVDAIYLSGSSIVGETLSIIADIAAKAKVITVTHLGEKADRGVLLAVSANSRALGRLAGEKAVKVLRGAKPSSIPIEPLKRLDVIVNMKAARAGHIDVPPAFLKAATRVIE
jgi:putative ABC transport system substrate-binding protein